MELNAFKYILKNIIPNVLKQSNLNYFNSFIFKTNIFTLKKSKLILFIFQIKIM